MPPQESIPWLRLALTPGVTPRQQRALLQAFGDAEGALRAPASALRELVGDEASAALQRGPQDTLLERTLRWAQADRHHLVTLADPRYPGLLREIHDPPCVLHVAGELSLLQRPAVAVVGSRNATAAGKRDAEALARDLSAAGLAIVSGMALGIDAAAHRGGLAGPGSSIAVVGTGIDVVYPEAHAALAAELSRAGCIVSEFPLGMPPLAGNFRRRNRLISGLSRGVVVVEANLRSGSLITARSALEQGREVFAVPGSIHSPVSKGCHALLRDGAGLVEGADDVLRPLRIPAPAREAGAAAKPPPHPLLETMGFAPATIDEIAASCGLAAHEVAAQLVGLEIEGLVAALPGGRYQRAL